MLPQRIKYTSQEIRKYLWYASKLLCINETDLNFSIKDGIKSVTKTKKKNRWSSIYQGLHCA